jgi:hypothetical protein
MYVGSGDGEVKDMLAMTTIMVETIKQKQL